MTEPHSFRTIAPGEPETPPPSFTDNSAPERAIYLPERKMTSDSTSALDAISATKAAPDSAAFPQPPQMPTNAPPPPPAPSSTTSSSTTRTTTTAAATTATASIAAIAPTHPTVHFDDTPSTFAKPEAVRSLTSDLEVVPSTNTTSRPSTFHSSNPFADTDPDPDPDPAASAPELVPQPKPEVEEKIALSGLINLEGPHSVPKAAPLHHSSKGDDELPHAPEPSGLYDESVRRRRRRSSGVSSATTTKSDDRPESKDGKESGDFKGKLWSDWQWRRYKDGKSKDPNGPESARAPEDEKGHAGEEGTEEEIGTSAKLKNTYKRFSAELGVLGKKVYESTHYGGETGRGRRNREY